MREHDSHPKHIHAADTPYIQLLRHNLPHQCCNNLAGTSIIAELAEIDSLPRSQIQPPACDRNRKRDTRQTTFGMTGHIVTSFICMLIITFIFRNQPIVYSFHIIPHRRIIIFIDTECTTKRFSRPVSGKAGRCFSTSSVTR